MPSVAGSKLVGICDNTSEGRTAGARDKAFGHYSTRVVAGNRPTLPWSGGTAGCVLGLQNISCFR